MLSTHERETFLTSTPQTTSTGHGQAETNTNWIGTQDSRMEHFVVCRAETLYEILQNKSYHRQKQGTHRQASGKFSLGHKKHYGVDATIPVSQRKTDDARSSGQKRTPGKDRRRYLVRAKPKICGTVRKQRCPSRLDPDSCFFTTLWKALQMKTRLAEKFTVVSGAKVTEEDGFCPAA